LRTARVATNPKPTASKKYIDKLMVEREAEAKSPPDKEKAGLQTR
jgi:hypothetical protein